MDFYITVLTRYSDCVDICTHCMLQGEAESINQRIQECIMSDKDLYQDILMYKVGQQCSCVNCAGNIIHSDHSFCLQYESLRTRLCTIITAIYSMYLSQPLELSTIQARLKTAGVSIGRERLADVLDHWVRYIV